MLSAADLAMYEGKHARPRPRRALHAPSCGPSSSAAARGSSRLQRGARARRLRAARPARARPAHRRDRPARAAAAPARATTASSPGRTPSCRSPSASTSSRRSTAGCSRARLRCCATPAPADMRVRGQPRRALDRRRSGRSRCCERELGAGGLDPSRLIVEVTETAAIANMQEARDVLRRAGAARRPDGARRLRLRLRLLLLPQAPAGRLPQDRRRVHRRARLAARSTRRW